MIWQDSEWGIWGYSIWSIRITSFVACYCLCVHAHERHHCWMDNGQVSRELFGCQKQGKNAMLFCLHVLAGQPRLELCWGSISHSTAPVIPSGEEHRGSVLNPLVPWLSGWSQYCQDEAVSPLASSNCLCRKQVKPRHLAVPSELQGKKKNPRHGLGLVQLAKK